MLPREINPELTQDNTTGIKKEGKGRIPWDKCLPESLPGECLTLFYFEMLMKLQLVKFVMSFKPVSADPNIMHCTLCFVDAD